MHELVRFLKNIENGYIPISVYLTTDLLDIMEWNRWKSGDCTVARRYLASKDQYTDELDFEMYLRDLYTKYILIADREHRKSFKELINDQFLNQGKICKDNCQKLIDNGFKMYPVSYGERMSFGIMTKVGSLIIEEVGL